ncbi:MAG: DUF87 domain-containing protein [Desulfurococcaceae archaeon]
MIKVGSVSGWDNDIVNIVIRGELYKPSFGDLLYTYEKQDKELRVLLMEVVGFTGRTPVGLVPMETAPVLNRVQEEVVIRARLFLEIIKKDNEAILVKASRPPSIMSSVYLIKRQDPDSEEIMEDISKFSYSRRGGKSRGIGVVVLRSGTAHSEKLAKERYFMSASLNLDLVEILRKHVLVSGQTGSGKTSGMQGLILKYAMESDEKIGWLIIDRHGEYSPAEGYVKDKFIGVLVDSVRANQNLKDTGIFVARLSRNQVKKGFATVPGFLDVWEMPLKASSVSFSDFAALGGIDAEKLSMLEEIFTILADAFRNLSLAKSEKASSSSLTKDRLIAVGFDNLFIHGDDPEKATANMIALFPLLVDNMIRYEGIGLPRDQKSGLHRLLVDRGIDAKTSRILRRIILSIMGWRTRTINVLKDKSVTVIDDSKSLIKVSPTLKDVNELPCLLEALSTSISKMEPQAGQKKNYKWSGLCDKDILEAKGEDGLDAGKVVDLVDSGNIVILDVSSLDAMQADLAVLTIVRRIFEHRLELGVEESGKKPVLALVSEEAPLYLSPGNVSGQYNPFARVAREGRKFGVGLVAITQLATIIEKQLLANFNTLILLRTRSRSDIEMFRDLGIPVETLPFLGDRECFLYTPDLPIKESIPAYLPPWFAEEYIRAVEQRRRELDKTKIEVVPELLESLELGDRP